MNSTNEKDPRAGNTGPFENHSINTRDYPTEMTFGKASPSLRASFASAGYLVYDGSNNDYFVLKADLGMTRYCRDYAAFQAFTVKLGVNHE